MFIVSCHHQFQSQMNAQPHETKPIPAEGLAWLHQAARIDGATYAQVLLMILERLELLEKAQESTCKQSLQVPPTPEAAPVATDDGLVRCYAQAVEDALKAGHGINGAAAAGLRAIYNLGRQHGAAQPPAAQPAPVAPEPGEVEELMRRLRDWHSIPLLQERERIATLLKQLSAPAQAVVPVAVSERLSDSRPESEGGDCDMEGRCWWFSPPACGPHKIRPCWTLDSEVMEGDSYWLPARAIPLPQAGEGEG